MIKAWVRSIRKKIEDDLAQNPDRRFFSPAVLGLYHANVMNIRRYSTGRLLDIGCGHMPYRRVIESLVTCYETLDVEQRTPGITYLGTATDMKMIASETYDSVVCFEVLEHIAEPQQAISEIARVLKKGGVCILSVPFLSRLHEEPQDFYRYTRYALEYLMVKHGFEIVTMTTTGSLFSFMGHQASTLIVCLVWKVPILKEIVFSLNKWLVVLPCYWLDKVLFRNGAFPLGYACVAKKLGSAG